MAFYRGPQIVKDGLVLWLDAANNKSYTSGSAIWRDMSGNNYNFTGSGNYGYSNGGIIFNRNNAANTGTIFTLSNIANQLKIENFLGSSFTIETWVLPQTLSSSNFDATEVAQGLVIWPGYHNGPTIDSTTLSFSGIWNSTRTGVFSMLVSSSIVTTQKYQQIVTTINYGSTVSNGYLNGALVFTTGSKPASVMTSAGGSPANTLNIGAARTTDGYRLFYTGSISVVKLYNRALSQSEVQQNFNALRGRYNL
jgi:hypothetical protein